MNIIFIKKYASLLLNYCMELKSGERLLVSTTTLAEPLVAELYRQCQQMGVIMEAILEWEGKSDDFNDYGHNAQAGYINPLYKEAMESFEAYLVIRAPFPSKSRSKPNSTLNEVR
ncbi:MAG TPA: aminopeptidase, partial [Saprospiraceae bacterium]|nr:aminopeptidase [Saprospiraceae bacterium]